MCQTVRWLQCAPLRRLYAHRSATVYYILSPIDRCISENIWQAKGEPTEDGVVNITLIRLIYIIFNFYRSGSTGWTDNNAYVQTTAQNAYICETPMTPIPIPSCTNIFILCSLGRCYSIHGLQSNTIYWLYYCWIRNIAPNYIPVYATLIFKCYFIYNLT